MTPEDTLKKILGTNKLQKINIGVSSGTILTQNVTGKKGKFLHAYSGMNEAAVVVQTNKGKELWAESEIYNLHKKAWV